jgi:hypothetical protein
MTRCRSLRRTTYPQLLHHSSGHDPRGVASAPRQACRTAAKAPPCQRRRRLRRMTHRARFPGATIGIHEPTFLPRADFEMGTYHERTYMSRAVLYIPVWFVMGCGCRVTGGLPRHPHEGMLHARFIKPLIFNIKLQTMNLGVASSNLARCASFS